MSMSQAMSKKFGMMSGGEKVFFFGALVLFICTCGFAFPRLIQDDGYAAKFG